MLQQSTSLGLTKNQFRRHQTAPEFGRTARLEVTRPAPVVRILGRWPMPALVVRMEFAGGSEKAASISCSRTITKMQFFLT
jgi:hypothetical protein